MAEIFVDAPKAGTEVTLIFARPHVADYLKCLRDSATGCITRESRDRVRLIALIHEQLYQAGDLSRPAFEEQAESLTSNLLRYYTAASTIKLNIDVCEILISIDLAVF